MAYYNNRQGYCEDDRMSYTEQSCGSRPGNYMRPSNNHMQMSQCDSYSAAGAGYGQGGSGYGQGGSGYSQGGYYAPTPAYNSGACFDRKEEFCVSNSNSRCHRFRPSGHRSRRVMRFSESRGSYSSSESDSD